MGTMFALLLAAALQSVGDIKTGSDLLAACSQKDTRTCDQFIAKVISDGPAHSCAEGRSLADIRRDTVKILERDEANYRYADASFAVRSAYAWCGSGD